MLVQAKILDNTPDRQGHILVEFEGNQRKACLKCNTLVYRGPNLIEHIEESCNCPRSPNVENVKLDKKFIKQMEKYRAGIIEDLSNGRDVSAIICGYGFTFEDEYKKAYKWIKENISEFIKNE